MRYSAINVSCPLCDAHGAVLFNRDSHRDYYRCVACRLVFVPPQAWLTAAAEKAEYDLHRNQVDDPGYRNFLNRLFQPLQARLAATAEGLDFGCGPGPALATMLTEAGHNMTLYDRFYAPDREALDRDAFAGWHYKNDPTHICFFSRDTFNWLAARWGAELEFIANDVIIFTRRR